MYNTGDLGSLASDGCLTHLGRKDFQVKIRGQRVELPEVEAALLRSPGIREAVAVAADDTSGSNRIVAYVVPRESPAPTVSRIRAALATALPGYMIPSSFVFLDALPLAPSGKVDRLALPAPMTARPLLDNVCIAPRNAVEERLTRIWENVLGVEPIGVQDNFFELGGHSLSAARLFAEIEEVFGKRLQLPLLLQAPTIEQLAGSLEQDVRDEQGVFLLGIQTKGSRPPLFCVETINAGIFVHLARHLGPEQPCYGLHPFGLARSRKPRVEIKPLASRYLEEVRKVQPEGPYFLCGMCTGGVLAFEMAQQLKARGDDVAFLALLDTFSPPPRWLNYVTLCPGWGFIARQFERSARHVRNLSQLAFDGRVAYVRQLAARRAARVEAERGHNKYLQQLTTYSGTLLQAAGRAGRCYRPKPYRGRLILFLANGTTLRLRHGSRLAWRELATDGAEVHTVPGVHEHILSEPNVRVLARYFKAHLEEAQASACGLRT